METIRFTLNGRPVRHEVEGERTLLWVLRTDLSITGPKYGCGEGLCGACTVLANDEAVLSCQLTIKEVDGSEITTLEGLARKGALHPLQKAFIEPVGFQCGYCTPGIAMCLTALMESQDGKKPSPRMVRDALGSNICRCTGYTKILSAVSEVLGHADAAAGEEGP